MAALLLTLLAGVTALLVVGAEGSPPGTLPVGAGGPWGGTPWHQHLPDIEDLLSDEDIMSGEELPDGLDRCDVCMRVVKKLTSIAVHPKTKAAMQHLIKHTCGLLPVGKEMCRDLLNRSLMYILNGLKKDETPVRLCTHLRCCRRQR